jgi:futalosine hydrolase
MPKGILTGLVSAVPFEARLILKEMKNRKKVSPAITSGAVGKSRVVHMASGMGVANAAHAATVLCERFSPDRIIVFGIGGAYPGSGLNIGNVVLAEKEVYADMGLVLADGFFGLKAIGIPLLKKGRKEYFNEFPLDARLLKKALNGTYAVRSGAFATVNASTGTAKRAREIAERTGAACENMEGAAVAHVCARYGIPLLEIRGISNIVPDRDNWDKNLAADNCQEAVLELLKAL